MIGRFEVRSGVNRTVLLVGGWAIKLPWGEGRVPVRGWLSNRSEWRQRHRPDVSPPRWTFGHVVLVGPRADATDEEPPVPDEYGGDEAKPSSWGRFGDRWLLVDFDRSWDQRDRGVVGWVYFGNQERLARRWLKLPVAHSSDG